MSIVAERRNGDRRYRRCDWGQIEFYRPSQRMRRVPIVLIAVGVEFLCADISGYLACRRALQQYRTKQFDVAEGTVNVLQVQSAGGHTGLAVITIGRSARFALDFFSHGPGYHTTILHGGVLGRDSYARVSDVDGILLKVEVPRPRL
jgi:hypothetical protein